MYRFKEFGEIERGLMFGRYQVGDLKRIYRQKDDPNYRFAFVKILSALQNNWDRVSGLALFPSVLLQSAMRHQWRLDQALLNVLGQVKFGEIRGDDQQRVWDEYDRLPELRVVETIERATTDDFTKRDMLIGNALSDVVSAMVVDAWTAFEVAVVDTWIALVNERPKTLGGRLVSAHVAKDDEAQQKNQQKAISFRELQKYDFDVSGHMGDVLQERYKLRTLDQIRQAYKTALGESNDLWVALSAPDLWALHAVRNVLVHNGGKVDGKFVKDMRSHAEFNSFAAENTLELSSAQALKLMDAGFDASRDIVFGASDWLDVNPD